MKALIHEDVEQEAVIDYCRLLSIPIIHIPNEGKRSKSYASKLKRMGLAKGFPDLFIPLAKKGAHGLFVELKVGNNKTTEEQREWLSLLRDNGYAAYVCRGFQSAKNCIDEYLKEDTNLNAGKER